MNERNALVVAGKVTDVERALVLSEGERRGWPAAELDAAISIESGWDPQAFAPSTNAGGLIGFMPFVLRKLGWTGTPESFRAQNAGAQAPWVGKFFDLINQRWRVPGDTYLALAASGHVGDNDADIVYKRGSKAWELNPGWRDKVTGEITAGSIRRVLLRRMKQRDRGVPKGEWGTDEEALKREAPKLAAANPMGLLVLAGLAWWAWNRYFRKGRKHHVG